MPKGILSEIYIWLVAIAFLITRHITNSWIVFVGFWALVYFINVFYFRVWLRWVSSILKQIKQNRAKKMKTERVPKVNKLPKQPEALNRRKYCGDCGAGGQSIVNGVCTVCGSRNIKDAK